MISFSIFLSYTPIPKAEVKLYVSEMWENSFSLGLLIASIHPNHLALVNSPTHAVPSSLGSYPWLHLLFARHLKLP